MRSLTPARAIPDVERPVDSAGLCGEHGHGQPRPSSSLRDTDRTVPGHSMGSPRRPQHAVSRDRRTPMDVDGRSGTRGLSSGSPDGSPVGILETVGSSSDSVQPILFGLCHRFQVIGIHTATVAAQMVEEAPIGRRTPDYCGAHYINVISPASIVSLARDNLSRHDASRWSRSQRSLRFRCFAQSRSGRGLPEG